MPDTPECTPEPEAEKAMKDGHQIVCESKEGQSGVEREGGTPAGRPLSRHEQRLRDRPNHGRDINER